ncbi:MAG: sulfatase [Salinigranum sp.]
MSNRISRRIFDTVRPGVRRIGLMDVARRVQERVLPPSLIHEIAHYESATTTTDRALEWLDGRGEFFLWVHYMEPHRPYGINLENSAYGESMRRSEVLDLMATAGVRPDRISPVDRRRLVDLYDSDLRYTSEQLGRLFDALRRRGRWEETDVVLTADHGEEFGEHGSYFHRNRPYDELLHVPLFVRSGRTDGGVVDEQRELLDVAPTICEFHGVDPPESFLGRSLFSGGPRRVVSTGSFRDDGQVVAARWDGWKYVRLERGSDELYDLDADPGERRNVVDQYPAVAARYREAVPGRLFDGGGDPDLPDASDLDGDARRRLEGLGYLE